MLSFIGRHDVFLTNKKMEKTKMDSSNHRGRPVYKIYSFDKIRGLVTRSKAHRVLSEVSVYNAEQAGITTNEEKPWVVQCEHGEMVAAHTLPIAKWLTSKPDSWCSKCKAKFDSLQELASVRSGLMDRKSAHYSPVRLVQPQNRVNIVKAQ